MSFSPLKCGAIALGLLMAATTARAAIDCKPDARLDVTALPAQRIVVIGERTHGTQQAPALLSGLLCGFARAGQPVILAWEASRDAQPALNAFLDSAGSAADRERLAEAAMRDPSGRTSLAMLDMLDSARRLRQAGARVGVVMVDNAESDVLEPLYPAEDRYALWSQARRQALMAQAVLARQQQYPNHRLLFFTSHAGRTGGELGAGYESATLLLSRLTPVHVVGLTDEGGEAWSCRGPTLPEAVCKAYPSRAGRRLMDADETLNLGPVTASPPASRNPVPIYVAPPASR
ncbi:MAG: hypothetical protein ACT6S0_20010 [Roseateles sp.]|uniref:hypothetical protein n=1 Tax=Roseateles sp. TaxID=1971397 RepID=UPI004036B3A6